MERKISSKTNKNLGKKIFKKLAFMSLAVCMGALTLFGTACTPTQGSQSPKPPTRAEMTTEQGLITLHKNDPTLYTTESGIEIKFGLSSLDIETSLSTGNLQGFPYFTTSNGTTTYTWVIIGQAEDKPLGASKPASFLFSNWTSLSEYYINKNYFSNNILDTTTPAGSAINSVSPSKSYVIDSTNFGDLTTNEEIPMGCVLALVNNIITTTYWNSTWENSSHWFASTSNRIHSLCKGYATNDTFGFGTLLNSVQVSAVTQMGIYYQWSNQTTAAANLKFFPLGTTGNDNFVYSNYLTNAQIKLSSKVWGRTQYHEYATYYLDTNGSNQWMLTNTTSNTAGVRPACVISLL